MVNIRKIQKRFQGAQTAVKVGIIVIMAFLILMIFYSFTNLVPFSIVNVDGKSEFTGGEKQIFKILLSTQAADSYTTEFHHREQYGRWRIEDAEGNILSPGKISKLPSGVYNTVLAVEVPNKQGAKLIAELIEYQFSRSEMGGDELRDEGTIKDSTEIELTLKSCSTTTDCITNKLCSGKTYTCSDEGLCISEGECSQCDGQADCSAGYKCENQQCYKIPETTALKEFLVDYPAPLTQTGYTVEDSPTPKSAPRWLFLSVFVMTGVLVYLVSLYKKRRGKR